MPSYQVLSSFCPEWSPELMSNSGDRDWCSESLLQALLDLQSSLCLLLEPLCPLQVSVGCLSLSGLQG